ncbi:MAG: translation initiation factor IF-3 [Planctomycetota bacterium]|nr:translation initiation factor IF-3 [Planctomycetota bacterium]
MRVNDDIRVKRVRLVDDTGHMVGVVPIEDARRLTVERGLDLVEVSPDADPPVCRIMDFGKFKYEQKQKSKQTRKKQHTVKIKELRMKLATDAHDVGLKVKHAREFLQNGDKVLISLSFRGREVMHKDLGIARMNQIQQELAPICKVEKPLSSEGSRLHLLLSPK